MIDIGAYGLSINVVALQSFPMGFSLSEFADDADPLVVEETEPFGYELLFDGDIFSFDKASVIKLSVTVIAGSEDDTNLRLLLQSKKGSKSILPVPDMTTMVITYPTGHVILTKGTIISGPLADSSRADGRKHGNKYTFVFAAFAGTQTTRGLIGTIAQNVLSIL